MNGVTCGSKNENGPFNYNNPLIIIGQNSGSFLNGSIDELKFFKTNLGEAEIKKLFINTGRSLVGFYPLGEKIDNTGQVQELSGNGFHGQLKDQNKNNATTITASQNYEIRLSSSLPANNRSSYFGRDRFVEVGYQEKLNPEKFTLIGWIKPNNDLHTMEGILSSEYTSSSCSTSSSSICSKGYGLYRWIYRSYRERSTPVSADTLIQRDGSSIQAQVGPAEKNLFVINKS